MLDGHFTGACGTARGRTARRSAAPAIGGRHQTVAIALQSDRMEIVRPRPSASSYSVDRPDICVDELRSAERRLRVAVVTETYPPEVNGVALTIHRFVEGLRARGHDVQLVRPRQTRFDEAASHEVIMRGLPIPRYPHLKMGLPARSALLRLWSLHRPDVVHIVTEGPLGWSALQAASKLKLPTTSDFRTNFHAYSGHYGIGWLRKPILAYLRKFHNRTQCTMVPTDMLQRELQEVGFRGLRVVSRGVDTLLFSPLKRSHSLRRAWGVAPDAPVVLYVGRLASEKNIDLVLEAFEAMREAKPNAKLVLVGDGPMRATLETRAPYAIFTGMQRNEDLATHYASGDIFLFPSLTETFGNVTPEAMASGLTVVAYNYAAAAELIVDRHNGRVAEYNNASVFVHTAVDAVREWKPSATIACAARLTAESMEWSTRVQQLEDVLFAACSVNLDRGRALSVVRSVNPHGA
jgi:glycosyltransferase involved in cell wall biosynthesis